MSAAEDLELFLMGPEPDYELEPFAPEDNEQADRWLRALGWHIAQRDENDATYRAALAKLDEFREDVNRGHEQSITWLSGALRDFHKARFERDGTKSIALPAGKLSSRAGQPKFDFDEDKFIDWAQSNAPYMLVQKVDAAEAKKALELPPEWDDIEGPIAPRYGNESVPGVLVSAPERSFTVKPA